MNPHYITYNFLPKAINHDELRLTIIIRVDAEGTNQTYQAEDEEIYWADLGEKEDEYSLEDFLLSNAFYKSKLVVPEESDFAKYFFATDGSIYESAYKRADVLIEMKYYPSESYEEEFRGKMIEDSIDYDPDANYFIFEASPETDILNKTMLYSLDDEPVPLNPLGLSITYERIRLKELILKCYQLVNPDLVEDDIILQSDWLFTAQHYYPSGELRFVDGKTINDVWISPYHLFFNPSFGLSNVGDVLRKLAMDFGCFTGMITSSKAFFKKLFSYESGDVRTLSDEDYYTNRLRFQLNIITYVRVSTMDYGETFEVYHAPNEAAFTKLENSYIERESALYAFIPYWSDPFYGYGNMSVWHETEHEFYDIVAVKDPSIIYDTPSTVWYNFADLSYVPYGRLLADFWYAKRGQMRNCRIDNFKPEGLKYDMSNVFNFKTNTYQPLRIKKLYKEWKTEIDGIISQ